MNTDPASTSSDDDGLFPNPSSPPGSSRIRDAAGVTITALRKAGALDDTHALKVALIEEASAALDREFARSRVSVAATTLFGRTLDTADSLPTFQEAVEDSFQKLTEKLEEVSSQEEAVRRGD